MITDFMREEIATLIMNNLLISAKVGLGGNSTNPIATDLDVALSVSPTITKTKSNANVIEAKISIAGSSIQGKVLREAGIFKTSNEMVQRVNFSGIGPFSTTETIDIFILMEVE